MNQVQKEERIRLSPEKTYVVTHPILRLTIIGLLNSKKTFAFHIKDVPSVNQNFEWHVLIMHRCDPFNEGDDAIPVHIMVRGLRAIEVVSAKKGGYIRRNIRQNDRL